MGKLVRIWKNKITGELANYQVNDNYISTNLVYDSDSEIVYYKFSEVVTVYSKIIPDQMPTDTKVGFMSPYFSHTGRLCRFTGHSIIECY